MHLPRSTSQLRKGTADMVGGLNRKIVSFGSLAEALPEHESGHPPGTAPPDTLGKEGQLDNTVPEPAAAAEEENARPWYPEAETVVRHVPESPRWRSSTHTGDVTFRPAPALDSSTHTPGSLSTEGASHMGKAGLPTEPTDPDRQPPSAPETAAALTDANSTNHRPTYKSAEPVIEGASPRDHDSRAGMHLGRGTPQGGSLAGKDASAADLVQHAPSTTSQDDLPAPELYFPLKEDVPNAASSKEEEALLAEATPRSAPLPVESLPPQPDIAATAPAEPAFGSAGQTQQSQHDQSSPSADAAAAANSPRVVEQQMVGQEEDMSPGKRASLAEKARDEASDTAYEEALHYNNKFGPSRGSGAIMAQQEAGTAAVAAAERAKQRTTSNAEQDPSSRTVSRSPGHHNNDGQDQAASPDVMDAPDLAAIGGVESPAVDGNQDPAAEASSGAHLHPTTGKLQS